MEKKQKNMFAGMKNVFSHNLIVNKEYFMKALILYASKTGASEDVAQYIASKFENSKIVNLSNSNNLPNLNSYDKIIVGSGVYFSKIHADLKSFLCSHLDELENKDFGVFFCCGSTDEKKRKSVMTKNFCPQLQNSALAIACVGGKLNYKRAGFPQKIIVYLAIKFSRLNNKLPVEINYQEVDKFIVQMKNISKQELPTNETTQTNENATKETTVNSKKQRNQNKQKKQK